MKKYNVELLAPAGSKEAFLGAIHAGADAVYLAGNKYGARAYADNFSEEELLYCIRYAHIWGRKVYLTVNTLLKENELLDLYDYIVPFYEAGLDACIVQDMGVFQYLKKYFPDMELHASTQMTITGEYGAAFLKELGATRIVPARELSLSEIRNIKIQTGIEVETFIHGAMCYCYSGQCLFSSILGGRSGNRGRCAQPCRLSYKTERSGDKQEVYPLSLKDMCTLENIEELMDAGIDSFKIEGRMKKPEYAAGVTSIYRKYIDLKNRFPDKKLIIHKGDLDKLTKLYIRSQRHNGYYFKQNGKEMVTIQSPSYSGSDEALIKEIREKYIINKPLMPVSILGEFRCGEVANVTFLYEDISVTVYGEMVSEAQKQPLTYENIKKQLCKLGDSSFRAESVEIEADENIFYSLKALNDLRRKAVTLLEDELIKKYGFAKIGSRKVIKKENMAPHQAIKRDKNRKFTENWSVILATKEQLEAFALFVKDSKLRFERIIIESELIGRGDIDAKSLPGECYIAFPYCMRLKDMENMEKIVAYAGNHGYNGFLVRNMEEFAYLKQLGYKGHIIGDASIPVWNSIAKSFWSERLHDVTCSYELRFHEYEQVFENDSYEKLIYGRIPMMVTANCIQKTMHACLSGKEPTIQYITDRYGKRFPVMINCQNCYNVIFNSVPLSLHKELKKYDMNCMKRIMFTIESPQETYEVLKFFNDMFLDKSRELPFTEYTTAHENRGVE